MLKENKDNEKKMFKSKPQIPYELQLEAETQGKENVKLKIKIAYL